MRMSKTRRNIVFLQSPRSDTLESFSLADTIAALRADDPAVTIVVDNSIVTSLRERPLHYGADIVWASVSKYYSGHGTVLAGVAYSNDETTLHTWRMDARYLLGLILGHQAAREALQGLETLAVRLEQSTAHAQVLVDELRTYPWVTHLQHVNSLIAFHCAEAEWVVNSLQKFDLSVHWGHVRSTAVYDMWADRIRLSIGLESPSELLADLRQAFARNFLTREVR
jgi:cystathionine gamma-synthase